jgi:hypothetical protein
LYRPIAGYLNDFFAQTRHLSRAPRWRIAS